MRLPLAILPPAGRSARSLLRPEALAEALRAAGYEVLEDAAVEAEGVAWARRARVQRAEDGASPLTLELQRGPNPLADSDSPLVQETLELAMAAAAPQALRLQVELPPGDPYAAWERALRLAWALTPAGAALIDVPLLRPLRRSTRSFFLARPAGPGVVRTQGLRRAGLPELEARGLLEGREAAFAKALRPAVEAWVRAGDPEAEVIGPGGVALRRLEAPLRPSRLPAEAASAELASAEPASAGLASAPVALAPSLTAPAPSLTAPAAAPAASAPTHVATPPPSEASASDALTPPALPPGALALASLLLPGLGQILLGQTGKGVVMLALTPLTLGLLGLLNLFAAVDAALLARRLQRGEPVGPWSVL